MAIIIMIKSIRIKIIKYKDNQNDIDNDFTKLINSNTDKGQVEKIS